MILVNGLYQQQIDITDRGFQYGDGLFETIEVLNSTPLFFSQHLARLELGCHKLGLHFPGVQLLTEEAELLMVNQSHAVLKIIVTRGSGGRGYKLPEQAQPSRVLSLHPFPVYRENYQNQGIVARFCQIRLGLNPFLAGIKHLNRLEQVMARAEWSDPDIQEGLMLDINDHVIEGTHSNLFYVKNGQFYTAELIGTGIAGVVRKIIIQLLAIHHKPVIEHQFNRAALLAADELFVCNSIIGIWPIIVLAEKKFSVGVFTRQIQAWYADFKHQEL
ncbi:MAG: aminodeoxychorismate lyase [Methylococcaceae bacterium]|jgi:4-amino-4-deoxychorismate lyase